MGLIHIKERGGDQERRFKNALRMAKEAIEEIKELSDEMEEEFASRGGYSGRNGGGYSGRDGGYSSRGGYYGREGWDGMDERRSRDSRGRFD
jgi:hypothetical protein